MEACCPGEGWQQVPGQRWCRDTILPISGSHSLHHIYDSSQEGCDYLVFRHDPLNIQDSFAFSFRIRHGFLPSNMNNWQIGLGAAFEEAPEGGGESCIREGLVLGVNFTGSDDLVKIWLVEEGIIRLLSSTALNYQEQAGSELAPLFRVQGDGTGNLELYWTPDPAQELPRHLVSCRIDGISWGRQLVLRYRYTSSRDRALWLDELVLEGRFAKDSLAPEITSVEFQDASTLQLILSEEPAGSDSCVFILFSEQDPGGLAPGEVSFQGREIQLTFASEIPNRVPCSLLAGGIGDADGNLMADTTLEILRNEAEWGDLVFSEIMADPEPAVRQVEEYVELYNRSAFPVNTEGWQLNVNLRSYVLDGYLAANTGGGVLLPGDYLLLTGITLPNEGALLWLSSSGGTLIHAAEYRIPWDGPDWKKEGGWSLESPDVNQPCRTSYLWEYSGDPGGGTPGLANSGQTRMEDADPPVLLYTGLGDHGEILLHYSEPLELLRDPATIKLDPGAVVPDSFCLVDPLRNVMYLHFPEDLGAWPACRLSLPPFRDCAGNRTVAHELGLEAPAKALPGTVLINEIMYDPQEGKPEFVELYLPGPAALDLRDLAIHLVEEEGAPDHPVPLSSHSRLVQPGQYLVLTECVAHLEEAYDLEVSGQWVELGGLPGLNNSSGRIYVTDRAGQVVDMAIYSDAMHMELLDDPGGISLERISGDRPGNDPGNWHSAASGAGYATPGRKNSQNLEGGDTEQLLSVLPEVFSPDNDGFEDLLEICISTGGNSWVIGLFITDLHGNRIRVLANGHLAGPSVRYTWDGEGEDGSMQPMGFYVIHARGYDTATGEAWVRRKAVGLVYR